MFSKVVTDPKKMDKMDKNKNRITAYQKYLQGE